MFEKVVQRKLFVRIVWFLLVVYVSFSFEICLNESDLKGWTYVVTRVVKCMVLELFCKRSVQFNYK